MLFASQELIAAGPQPGDIWRDPTTGMEFVWVSGESFRMGSNDGIEDEKPKHWVTVDSFWIGKYEVTQGQWQKIMGGNSSNFKKGFNYPVEQVSWNDCQEFIRKLNQQSGNIFRLPTEAEWEYACRAGTTTPFSFGSTISTDQANYDSISTVSIGSYKPNAFGLYDMHGNVCEWCADWYYGDYYSHSPGHNPRGPENGSPHQRRGAARRIFRGGSWHYESRHARSAKRFKCWPSESNDYVGFRLVVSERH